MKCPMVELHSIAGERIYPLSQRLLLKSDGHEGHSKVLFVDDDRNILNALRRLFGDDALNVFTCSSGKDALELLQKNEVAVVVSDNMMPGMKGTEFLRAVRSIAPETVRIMLTGYAEIQAAMDAINKGGVYKFITKPYDSTELRSIVLQSVERYSMVQSLKKADEHALYSLAQATELKDPYTKGHCARVAKYAALISETLDLADDLKENIKRGSWLHDCGKIGIPEDILNCKGPLSDSQMSVVKEHPRWGADIARLAHLPETVINAILYHHERYDGKGYPYGLKGEIIPIEARIVNVADIYDALTSEKPYRRRLDQIEAIAIVTGNKGTCSDPEIVDAFLQLIGALRKTADSISESMRLTSHARAVEEYLMNSPGRSPRGGRNAYL